MIVVRKSKVMIFVKTDAEVIVFAAPYRVRAWDLAGDTNILVLSLDI